MRRRTFLSGTAGASASLALAYGCRRSPLTQRTIQMSARPTLYMAPFYLAHESGYFTEAGLELELLPVTEGYENVALLAGGSLDVALSALTPALAGAIGQGAAVRIVAGGRRLTAECSDVGRLWGSRRSFPRGLDQLATLTADLRGKRVALNSRGSGNEFYLEMMLERAGLRMSDVEIVVVRFTEAAAAVLNGKIDAFVSPEQFSLQRVADSPDLVRGIGVVDVLPSYQYNFVVFGKNLLNSEPRIGAAFLRAYLRGVRDFAQGRTPNYLDEFARSNGFDTNRVRLSCRNNAALDGAIDRESIRILIQWFKDRGYAPPSIREDQLTDTRFLAMASQASV